MRRRRADENGHELSELAALAGGSLAPGGAAEVEAPASLRERIGTRPRARRQPGRRLIAVGSAAAVAVAAVVLVAALRNGTPAQQFRAALAPTDLVPGARGDATLTKTSAG